QEAGQVAPEAATAAIADGAGVAVDSVLTKMQELVNHGSCGNGKNNVRKIQENPHEASYCRACFR
ncbi:hypothetical protein EE612_028034, partial [Oryza sativa]